MLFTTDEEDKFDNRGCDKVDLNANVTLDKVHVHWTYNKGDNVIEMGYMNIEMLRNTMLRVLKKKKTDILTPELFEKYWFHSMDEDYGKNDPKEVFKTLLDKEHKGFLTVEDVKKLPADVIKEMARLMDPPHGPKKEDQLTEANLEIKDLRLGEEEEDTNDNGEVVNENPKENTSSKDNTKSTSHIEL